MNRHAQFVAIVQAAALGQCMAATLAPNGGQYNKSGRDIIDVMAAAVALEEEAIPHDVGAAAREFVVWQFDPREPEPEWHREWREANGIYETRPGLLAPSLTG